MADDAVRRLCRKKPWSTIAGNWASGTRYGLNLLMPSAVAAAAFGWLPVAISFALGVLASMALRTVALREVDHAIGWPVVVTIPLLLIVWPL